MDDRWKNTCPNCSQLYYIQWTSSPMICNLPLFITCGHTMCENCILNITKCLEPLECKVCLQNVDFKTTDPNEFIKNKSKLYEKFPINVYMVGELAIELIKVQKPAEKKADENNFIDLEALLKRDSAQGNCLECNATSSKMCKECNTILCEACFSKTHKNYVIFKSHVLQDTEFYTKPITCKSHIGKPLDYYCKTCKKAVCTDCMLLSGEHFCKNHTIVSSQEVNETLMEDLTDIYPQVDEIFRRLTKTAVDIGYLLCNFESGTGSGKKLSEIIANVDQHYSKLFSEIQRHKDEIINIILDSKFTERNSLQEAKSEIAISLKKAKNILNMITVATNTQNKHDLPALLEEAKEVKNFPWYLKKNETDMDKTDKESIKVTVNEDLCSMVADYMHLEESFKSVYKLSSTSELGGDIEIPPAPTSPVYPPELPKDARQSKPKEEKDYKCPALYKNAPKYHSKSGSVSSLNSNGSEISSKSYITPNNCQKQPVVQPVAPFLQNQQPQQLHEGSQELIYISHIVDPHNFFVQRACAQVLVKDMLRDFRNAVSFSKPSLSHIKPGKLYLVFNEADNMWQRCRVLSVDMNKDIKPIIQVFCFDFGSIEFVSMDKLRLLPPSHIQSPYPLAVNCTLFNCVPKKGSWTSEDSFLIQNIIDNKQAVIHIRRIIPISNVDFKLECDVTTFEHGISLAHALVFHQRAKLSNPRLPYPTIAGVKDKLKLYTGHNEFKCEKPELVNITHIVSPDKFYVRKLHLEGVYQKLSEDLEQDYSSASTVGTVYLPEKGMVCAVNVESNHSAASKVKWARGVVAGLPGRCLVRVCLPDTGLVVVVPWTALRYIHPKFTTLSALATECHLAGITPFNNKWNTASVDLLQKYMGSLLELQVEDNRNAYNRCRGSVGVTLYDKADDNNVVCINNEMVEHKLAFPFGVHMFNESPVEQVFTKKSQQLKPKPPAPSNSKITILKKKMSENINGEDLQAKDKGPLRLEVKILNYQSPSLIYVSLVHQQKNFNDLFDEMQKYYSKNNKNKPKDDWKVGDKCSTLCVQSQTWRRAVILELENDNAKVFYIDFACTEATTKSSLKELSSEFSMFGDGAIKCHLCGIRPAGGEEWPLITKEYLKEMLDAYKRIFITKLGNFKDKSMPIQLWVYHTEQGGALEPNRSTWRCLNQKILEQGLCIPDQSQVVSSESIDTGSVRVSHAGLVSMSMVTTEGNTEDNTGDTLSFLNITGSVNEWLQLDPLPMVPLNTVKSDDEIGASPSSSFLEYEDNKPLLSETPESSNVIFITDWLPAEPLPSEEFTAVPTYIDNDAVIYLHKTCQQDTLEVIRKALDVRFKDPDPKAKFTKWSVGELCVALFFLDKRFYRAKVIEVNNEKSTCNIHYIDYGNEEVCSFANMRKSVPLHQIPTQAHKCVLSRIRPLGEQWDSDTLDYLHKCIVEKQCKIKICGEPVNGVVPIELNYGELCINDHLVEFEMASYTDGSQPLIRKYAPVEEKKEVEEVIKSDSGPDYIVVDDADNTAEQLSTSHDSSDVISLKGADWNKLIEEEQSSLDGNYITYPINTEDEFLCNITIINNIDTLELNIVFDDHTTSVYEQMFEELQTESMDMSPLNGIFENKACVALFPDDGRWYRASILQYSEKKNKIKVRYVDYGNIDVISLADAREIHEEWAKLLTATVTAKLFGVRLNPDIDPKDVAKEYAQIFLDQGPFRAKVISYDDSMPLVELRDETNELVYKKLIDNNMFIHYE